MTRYLRSIVVLAVLIAATVVMVPLFRSGSLRPSGPAGLAGSAEAVIPMRDASGAQTSLDRYRGRVIVMNLWASWCPPCRAEMPDLQRLTEAYPASQLVVIGVNQGESPERARAFASALGIHFPIWIDDGQRYGRVYGAAGLPTTVIIGRDGIVTKGFDGPLTFDQMRTAVAPLLR